MLLNIRRPYLPRTLSESRWGQPSAPKRDQVRHEPEGAQYGPGIVRFVIPRQSRVPKQPLRREAMPNVVCMCKRSKGNVQKAECPRFVKPLLSMPGSASHTAAPMRQSFTSPLPDDTRSWPWMQSPLLPPLWGAYRQNKQDQVTDRHDCDACCVRCGGKAVEVALDSLPSPL